MVGEGRLPRTRDAEVFLLIRGSGWVRSAGAPVRGGVCGRGHAPPPFVGRTAHGPPVASCVCSDDTTVQLYCICIYEHEARSMTIVAYLSAAGINIVPRDILLGSPTRTAVRQYEYDCTAAVDSSRYELVYYLRHRRPLIVPCRFHIFIFFKTQNSSLVAPNDSCFLGGARIGM